MKHTVVIYKGQDVDCYGEIRDDSNFSVLCFEEEYDDVWTDGNLTTGKPFESWQEVVDILMPHFFHDICEISTC